MNFEEEVFQRTHVDFNKLIDYGFIDELDYYKYSTTILNEEFKIEIIINKDGILSGKVFDVQTNDEYNVFRFSHHVGSFVNKILEEYQNILIDIKENCYIKDFFKSKQANEIAKYIKDKFNVLPQFLWNKFPGYGVFKHITNDKWFGLILDINKSKLGDENEEIEIINLKTDENTINKLLKQKGIYKAYHMNKKNWISIVLDGTFSNDFIIELIDNSYSLINSAEEWIVPANPKYYDITTMFDTTNITEWKQSSNVHVGDIVYIYLGSPYSKILYKCKVVNVNIPYNYKDDNLTMTKVMNIELIKKYDNGITFKRLNELGIRSIRGPIKVSKDISKYFDE